MLPPPDVRELENLHHVVLFLSREVTPQVIHAKPLRQAEGG
jgi:hypothetical protein